MSLKHPAICNVPTGAKIKVVGEKNFLKIKCVFGRRIFYVKLKNPDSEKATISDLAQAIMRETNIPHDKQRLYFKGILMDPPDHVPKNTLENFNMHSGDQVLIMNSIRIATDDEVKVEMENILASVKVTNKEMEVLFYELDKTDRGYIPRSRQDSAFASIRKRAIAMEEAYMKYIERANSLQFDDQNAVDQAKRREMVDHCQRQIDKLEELTVAIFDRLTMSNAPFGGGLVLKVATNTGPCPRANQSYFGPC